MNRYYILHAPLAAVGVYDSLDKAQSAIEVNKLTDHSAIIESVPMNELISGFNVKRECFNFDGAWVLFEDPVSAEYTIT